MPLEKDSVQHHFWLTNMTLKPLSRALRFTLSVVEIWRGIVTYETSFTMRGAAGLILQRQQILHLPRKMLLSCYFTELFLLYWTVALLSCYFTELLLYWTVTELLLYWAVTLLSCCLTELLLSCYFTELLLDWAVTLLELLLDWTVALLNCYFTEPLLYWAVTLLSLYFTELLLHWAVTLLDSLHS